MRRIVVVWGLTALLVALGIVPGQAQTRELVMGNVNPPKHGTALAAHLRPAPAQSVRGYPEWKDKVATPAYQEYYSGAIDLGELRERLEDDGNLVLARYQR